MVPRKQADRSKPRRRLITVLIATVAVIGSFFATTAPAHADVTSAEKAIVQLYQQYTVQLSTAQADGSTASSSIQLGYSCTGFFVSSKGDIATAGHCVDPDNVSVRDVANRVVAILREKGFDDATIKAFLNATKVEEVSLDGVVAYQPKEVGGVLDADGFQVEVVEFKPLQKGDFALLRLNNFSQETPYLQLSSVDPEISQHVTAVGFPGVVTDTSDAGRQRVSYPDGKVISQQTQYGVPWVEVSVDLKHGMSGGPVIDDQNQVVGIVSWGHTSGGDEAKYITSLRGLRDFLTSNGVQLEAPPAPRPQATPGSTDGPAGLPAPAADDNSNGSGILVPVLIGVIALLVLGGGAFVLISRRRGKGGTPPAPPTHPTPPPASNYPPQS